MSELLSKCGVCGALLDEEDLFCSNCGTEAPAHTPSQDTGARVATHNFSCWGCGASMSYDASAGALRCPFCGSTNLEKQQDAKVLRPSRVIPFAVDQQQAVSTLRQWLGKGFWRPGDLSQAAVVTKMAAVYVPYWVFAARTHTFWTADTSQTPAGSRGDWFPLSGEHRADYSALLVGASGALTPAETAALCPFDLNQGVAPEQVDLDNVIVEQFGVARKYARPLARQGLEELERQACASQYVPARSRNVHVNVLLEGLTSEPVLLPVWIAAYQYRQQLFRFLVNGQSGQATGQAPTSWKKVAAAVGATIVAVLAVVVCAGLLALLANRR